MYNFYKSFVGLKRILSTQPSEKKIIFYSESQDYRSYFMELIINLKRNTSCKIYYVTSDEKDIDLIDGDLKPIYIGEGFFRTIFFTILNCDIIIMTLTNLGIHHLKKSKKCKIGKFFSITILFFFSIPRAWGSVIKTQGLLSKKLFVFFRIFHGLGYWCE